MRDSGPISIARPCGFSRLGVGALLIPELGWIVNQIAPRMSVFDNDRRLFAISKIDLVAPDFGLGFRSPDDR